MFETPFIVVYLNVAFEGDIDDILNPTVNNPVSNPLFEH